METDVKEIRDALMGVKTRIVTDSITLHDVDVINACIAALQDMVFPEPTIGGAELAGMPIGGVTIGSANIFVGIPPTSEEFFKFFPNGVGTHLSNSELIHSERVGNNEG